MKSWLMFFFANVVPGLDADTVRMHQLLVTRPTVVPRNDNFFLIYQRFYILSLLIIGIATNLEVGTASLMQNVMQGRKKNRNHFSISPKVFFWLLALRAPMQGHRWVSLCEKRLCL